MKLPITAETRAAIQRVIELARNNPCDFRDTPDKLGALRALDRFAMRIAPEVRVHFLHHTLASGRRLAHLALHATHLRFDEELVDQLAAEFGLGPRSSWVAVMINHPPAPSAHVFKRV